MFVLHILIAVVPFMNCIVFVLDLDHICFCNIPVVFVFANSCVTEWSGQPASTLSSDRETRVRRCKENRETETSEA